MAVDIKKRGRLAMDEDILAHLLLSSEFEYFMTIKKRVILLVLENFYLVFEGLMNLAVGILKQ